MHQTVENLIEINNEIRDKVKQLNLVKYKPNIIAVSKTFEIEHISPLIEYGHQHFGENKVQEAIEKWSSIKDQNSLIKLHMIGSLQTNKVKYAVKIFDYIHSVDSIKLAERISIEQKKVKKKPKIFIQVNLAKEIQKSGVNVEKINELYNFCKKNELDIKGLMCLPPFEEDSERFFLQLKTLNEKLNLPDLSMGMSHDYLKAIKYHSTYVRIGTKIFGKRN